ncbi:MAG: DUF1330 domain-containing protein [Candidatus Accumulibacter necessarius]|jgi:uncharacterized protein (DUF1330 family)|uniref:DUF1330 domain-containing protein n=1 Tax=Candidatus Accumulibacter necessarius TaxID=2954386 RepID=UPI002FC2A6E5
MAAYLLAEATVSDPLAYEGYQTLAQAAIAQYGGRYRARGGRVEVLEGGWTKPERPGDCRIRFSRAGEALP